MKSGYPFVIVPANDRKRYFNALEKADRGDFIPFVNLMAQFVENSLDLYLSSFIKTDEEQTPLSKLAKKTPYSMDYLGLLARKGEITAEKKGKVWYSSLKAIKDYQEKRERKRN
jgi:hypothetical protein